MISLAIALALAQTGPWTKYQSGPQKLIVTWAQGGVSVIDYPSYDRCQRAREAVEQESARRVADAASRATERGGQLVGSPWTVYALCIPG